MAWSEADIPDQTGRTVLITGANSGLGLRSAQVLAGRGAHVIMACRSAEKGKAALATVDGAAELLHLDLADLASVRKAAAEVRERTGDSLDVLMNNAGIMGTPHSTTADGFESQIGTNHLGHAALTWLLLPAVTDRVVTLSSLAHRGPGLDVDDLNWRKRRYRATAAYSAAKLANLVFAIELDRRLRAAGSPVRSVAAHPGLSNTELAANSFRARGTVANALTSAVSIGNRLITMTVERGALPQLLAATGAVSGGDYFGPTGPFEAFGNPGRAKPRAAARDADLGRRLWERTAELVEIAPEPS